MKLLILDLSRTTFTSHVLRVCRRAVKASQLSKAAVLARQIMRKFFVPLTQVRVHNISIITWLTFHYITWYICHQVADVLQLGVGHKICKCSTSRGFLNSIFSSIRILLYGKGRVCS